MQGDSPQSREVQRSDRVKLQGKEEKQSKKVFQVNFFLSEVTPPLSLNNSWKFHAHGIRHVWDQPGKSPILGYQASLAITRSALTSHSFSYDIHSTYPHWEQDIFGNCISVVLCIFNFFSIRATRVILQVGLSEDVDGDGEGDYLDVIDKVWNETDLEHRIKIKGS